VIDGAAAPRQAGDDLAVRQGEQLPDLAVGDGHAKRNGHPEALVEGACGAHLAGMACRSSATSSAGSFTAIRGP